MIFLDVKLLKIRLMAVLDFLSESKEQYQVDSVQVTDR